MADQREELVRKMVAEGTSDEDILATLKVFDAQQQKVVPAAPAKRPLLRGLTDAGVAAQLGNDPEAVKAFQSAKDTGANVGLLSGVAAMGGLAAGTPIRAAMSSGAVRGAGQALLAGGAYSGLKAMGVPEPIADALLIATGIRALRGGGKAGPTAQPEPSPNAGGRLIKAQPSGGIEQELANALSELRQPQTPKSVELAPQPQLPPGYSPRTSATPLRIAGAKVAVESPSRVAAIEAAAPKPAPKAGPPEVQRNVSVFRQPGDMPKSWHAFLNDEARGAAPATERQGISSLHREMNEMDAGYRNATAGERAMFQALPQAYKDALVKALLGR